MIAFFIVVNNYDIMMSMVKKPDIKKVHCKWYTKHNNNQNLESTI